MIEYKSIHPADSSAIEKLFIDTFTRSEGDAEGKLIGNLVNELIHQTAPGDLFGFAAVEGEKKVGAIFFSRLTFATAADVFMMAPVAVHRDFQGKGIGQNLIRYGLQQMKEKGTQIAVTYGDPAYYTKTGFEPLSQELIPPPLKLSQLVGWLGQSLTANPIPKLPGPSQCVSAFNNPAYW